MNISSLQDTDLMSQVCAMLQSTIQFTLVLESDYGMAKAGIPAHLCTSQWPSKLAYISQIIYKLTTPSCKLSLCLLYRVMCSTSKDPVIKMTRVTIWGTILLIVCAYSSAFLVGIFQCTPISKTWNKNIPEHQPTTILFEGKLPQLD